MGAGQICSQKPIVNLKEQDGLTRLMKHGFYQDNDEDLDGSYLTQWGVVTYRLSAFIITTNACNLGSLITILWRTWYLVSATHCRLVARLLWIMEWL